MLRLDATPEKRVFLSIIAEYDLKRCICELIDNAIDLWKKKGDVGLLSVDLVLDKDRQMISIQDNAGGVEEDNLSYLLSPGKTTNNIADEVIGYFGVGSKRAVVALAQDITIYTRFEDKKTFIVHFDDSWINDDPSWFLQYDIARKSVAPNTTLIELFKLRTSLTKEAIDDLEVHLGEVYAYFLELGVKITINEKLIKAIKFDDS